MKILFYIAVMVGLTYLVTTNVKAEALNREFCNMYTREFSKKKVEHGLTLRDKEDEVKVKADCLEDNLDNKILTTVSKWWEIEQGKDVWQGY